MMIPAANIGVMTLIIWVSILVSKVSLDSDTMIKNIFSAVRLGVLACTGSSMSSMENFDLVLLTIFIDCETIF